MRAFPLVMVLALAPGCSSGTTLELFGGDDAFVTRRGPALELNGRPFRFAGITANTLSGCGMGADVPTHEQLEAFLGRLHARTVLRTYASANRDLPEIERVVEAAARHGHKLWLVLAEHDPGCGDPEGKRTLAWYQGGYRDRYLPWIRRVVWHFRNVPTIAVWELIRGPLGVDAHTLRAFVDVVGGEIRSISPRHLIASGIQGSWTVEGEDGYHEIHASPSVDVATYVDWGAAADVAAAYEGTIRPAAKAGKPLVGTEVAFYGSRAGDPAQRFGSQSCLSWPQRRDLAKRVLDGAFAAQVSGALVWNYIPSHTGTGCSHDFGPDDPLLDLLRTYQPAP